MKVYNAMVVLAMLCDSEALTMVSKHEILYKGKINGFPKKSRKGVEG